MSDEEFFKVIAFQTNRIVEMITEYAAEWKEGGPCAVTAHAILRKIEAMPPPVIKRVVQ